MLVEINLLPKKERKNFTLTVIAAGLVSIFLLGTGLSLYYGYTLKKEEKLLGQQILQVKDQLTKQQAELTNVEDSNSVVELKTAVEWAETYPIKSVEILQHITSLLPERGFIQNYNYSEQGTVALTVQFDTAREAAHFLTWLNESEWIEEASISSLAIGGSAQIGEGSPSDYTPMDELPRYKGQFLINLNREKIKEVLYPKLGGDN